MPKLILFRHGQRFIDTGGCGDGPLTEDGIATVTKNAAELAEKISDERENVDIAIVSASVRCTQTFAIIFMALHRVFRLINSIDIHPDYYCTARELTLWNELYKHRALTLHDEIKDVGEKKLMMSVAPHLILPCAIRTERRIDRALHSGAQRILVVTHGPHDALIEGRYTGIEPKECLPLGGYRILEIPASPLTRIVRLETV